MLRAIFNRRISKSAAVKQRGSARGRNWKQIGLENLEGRLMMNGAVLATVFEDTNANGLLDPEEPLLQGWTVYVDKNSNGHLDGGDISGVTNIDGEALLTGIKAGTYPVRDIPQPGYAPTAGFSDTLTVKVVDGETFEAHYPNFIAQEGTIDGSVWNDFNNDGIRTADEPGLAGWNLFADVNGNTIQDPTEPTATTDANGNFLFSSVPVGGYKVYEVTPPGWEPTFGYDNKADVSITAGGSATLDFGNFLPAAGSITGTVWNDLNGDGVQEAGDLGIAGRTVYMDLNLDGSFTASEPTTVTDANGNYTFPFVTEGDYSVRSDLPSGWELSPGYSEAATVKVIASTASVADFASFQPVPGSIAGRVWNDSNNDGIQNGTEAGLSNWTVFADVNGNSVLDAGEPSAVTSALGDYLLTGVAHGSVVVHTIVKPGFVPTYPGTGAQLATLLNGEAVTGYNFGNKPLQIDSIGGTIFADTNKNGSRDPGEKGLGGITVFLDLNTNGSLDPGEPSTVTSTDLYYTPAVDESGSYLFDHLAAGDYTVTQIVPTELSATPSSERSHTVTLAPGDSKLDVNSADVYRANEIRGVRFNDLNGDHVQDPGEPALAGQSLYLDLNRNDTLDIGEPTAVSAADGSYAFTGLTPGAYVVRQILDAGFKSTSPTVGGILWPSGVSNPSIGNVTPTSITLSLAKGQTANQTVSLTLPSTGALTNMVDVFLLFDDTGSFTGNSPIVRGAFPQIISQLQTALPGINLGFGVGRFEEYANYASEYGTGRPFILNQPIASTTTTGFDAAIAAALNRTAPGYGGDQPESLIEALYQTVTGKGFDGNNNGSTTDSGAAGLAATQTTPGNSGDVPAFGSYVADTANSGLPAEGSLGGAGFRSGALPIILAATDTGFNYQPKGETSITGVNGTTLPLSSLTQASRGSTPFGSGAGIQETVTGLNALGALVIGLGTNGETNLDPRQDLSSLSKLTGATNQTTTTIANGTATPIAPGDPLYFQIASGFAASVANGVVAAIQNAVTNVAVNITLKASDPNVHIITNPGVINGVGAGGTATFDVQFTGDGIPHRFDLQFVRAGTNVVLGSIPVVIGTPIPGDGYEFEDLEDGEIDNSLDLGSKFAGDATTIASLTAAPTTVTVGNPIDFTADTVHPITGATITKVEFYRDSNSNGIFDDGVDPVIATDTSSVGGYTANVTATSAWGLSQVAFFARALDSVGNWSTPVRSDVYLNAAPVVKSFVVTPSPTSPSGTLTLKAPSVTDANLDGVVTSVSFYLDADSNGKFNPAIDTLVSTDTDGSDGWSATTDISGAATGLRRYFAQATDDKGAIGAVRAATTRVTLAPVVGSIVASPDPVSRGQNFTVTASDVSDPDGSVKSVEFWLDRDANGVIDPKFDLKLGTDYLGSDGWSLTTTSTRLANGVNTLLARAIDNSNLPGQPAQTTVTVDPLPTIAKLVAAPTVVTPDQGTKLTATGLSADTTSVVFYQDNGDGVLTAADTAIGTDSDGSDGWTNAVPAGLPVGKVIFFARAVNAIGGHSVAKSATVHVTTPPQINGAFVASPDPVSKGQPLTLSVSDVTDDESVSRVMFYRDLNGDGLVTAVDKLLATDFNGADGWSVNVSSGSTALSTGVNRLLAVARDNRGVLSAPKLTLVTIDAPPTISSLTASPVKPTTLQSVVLKVKASADTTAVDLFIDNGDGVFSSLTDSSLGSASVDATGAWVLTLSPGVLPSGTVKLWARAYDGLGYSAGKLLSLVVI